MLDRFRSVASHLVGRNRLESEMDAEMRDHIERYTNDLVRSGVTLDEARRQARVQFGSSERAKEECRQALGLRWADEVIRNSRHAARLLLRSPGFTIAAVLTLALCIGANTAIFSVIDAALLRPLPYAQPARLAQVATFIRAKGADETDLSQDGATWEAVRDQAPSVEAAVFSDWVRGVNLATAFGAQYVQQQRVSTDFFRVLGIHPLLGREFTAEEDRAGGPAATVLSYALWKRAFNADATVIGRSVTLRGEPYTVVGVMPAGFRSTVTADLWTPLRPSTTGEGAGENYGIVTRLRPGVGWAEAQARIETVGQTALRPGRFSAGVSAQLRLVPLQQAIIADVRRPLLILWGAVGMVLLIGCVNIAGLLLARAARRSREIATRMALGGGRSAVIRQLLTESLLLAVCGGAAGSALGFLGLLALKALGRHTFDILANVKLDGRVLAATAALALLSTVLFGLLPALEATRLGISTRLAGIGARSTAAGPRRWPRRLLLVAQVAMTIVLLVAAGLLSRTLLYLHGQPAGFDSTNVVTARLSLDDARYASGARANWLFKESLDRIRQLPGVEAAAVGLTLPYERALNQGFVRLDGPHADAKGETTTSIYVTEDYFRALRIPLLRGRNFRTGDTPQSGRVVVVNEAFVKRYLRDQDPIGSHLRMGGRPLEIVGVVGDVQQKPSWGNFGPLDAVPCAYNAITQITGDLRLLHTWFSPSWVVRASGPRGAVIAGMQRAMEAVDPSLPFSGFRTLDEVRAETLALHRFVAALLTGIAGLALLLAAVGIYGLIANSVVERTRELGIRMALGASLRQAVSAVALPGVLLALAGVALGYPLARVSVRLLQQLIWGIKPTDPLTFISVALGLLLVAAAASLVPALRVTRLNPAQTLRIE